MKKIISFAVFCIAMAGFTCALEEINISKMTIREKVTQMVIVKADSDNFTNMQIGGIFLGQLENKEKYRKIIFEYKQFKIKPFVSADMEGYWNPFENFYQSKNFGDIKDGQEAYELGKEHGEIMKELGFTIDFSPVVEIRNEVWPGRSFTGSEDEIKDKIEGYIKGLKEGGILSTAKHYPGGSMIKNPHWRRVRTEIFKSDLEMFNHAINNNVDLIMIGHAIVHGAIDSRGKPSTVSPEVIGKLRGEFDGLIISDAISMLGLRLSYLFNGNKMYVDLIKAGNDMIIDIPYKNSFNYKKKVLKRIDYAVQAVERGEISEDRIDESLRRILRMKGYKAAE